MKCSATFIVPIDNALDVFTDFELSFDFADVILATWAGQHIDHPGSITIDEIIDFEFLLALRVSELVCPFHIRTD